MKERHLFEDDYLLCGLLGRGRFATVYKCMNKSTSQYYAAKITQQRIDTEVAILRQFRHHMNIVSLHEVYQGPGESVLVLELVSGGEMLDLLGKCISSEYDVARIIKQLCSTLYCLHYKHVVHMDLKPENILICNTRSKAALDRVGQVKSVKPALRLVDFGMARILPNAKPGTLLQLRGTPEFLAPEMLVGDGREVVSPAIDMWCVGVTTYIALTGISPFRGNTDVETVTNIVHCSYYLGEDLFTNTSRLATDFISQLLTRSPRRRMGAGECLAHPWLSKKKRCKQKLSPLSTEMLSSVGVVQGMDVMSMIKSDLELLVGNQDDCYNIKPSSIKRDYKEPYK